MQLQTILASRAMSAIEKHAYQLYNYQQWSFKAFQVENFQ